MNEIDELEKQRDELAAALRECEIWREGTEKHKRALFLKEEALVFCIVAFDAIDRHMVEYQECGYPCKVSEHD